MLQIKLRLALINAVPRGHILFRAFHSANDHIQSLDLYQGSRLLLALRNIISEHIVNARRPYVQMAKLISRDLVQVANLDAVQVHSAVFKMQRSIQLLVRLGQNDAEAILVSDFIKIMLRHSSPAVRDTMKAARAGVGSHAPRSLFSLQASLLAYMPTHSMDESPTVHFILPDKQHYSHEAAQVHRAAPQVGSRDGIHHSPQHDTGSTLLEGVRSCFQAQYITSGSRRPDVNAACDKVSAAQYHTHPSIVNNDVDDSVLETSSLQSQKSTKEQLRPINVVVSTIALFSGLIGIFCFWFLCLQDDDQENVYHFIMSDWRLPALPSLSTLLPCPIHQQYLVRCLYLLVVMFLFIAPHTEAVSLTRIVTAHDCSLFHHNFCKKCHAAILDSLSSQEVSCACSMTVQQPFQYPRHLDSVLQVPVTACLWPSA